MPGHAVRPSTWMPSETSPPQGSSITRLQFAHGDEHGIELPAILCHGHDPYAQAECHAKFFDERYLRPEDIAGRSLSGTPYRSMPPGSSWLSKIDCNEAILRR